MRHRRAQLPGLALRAVTTPVSPLDPDRCFLELPGGRLAYTDEGPLDAPVLLAIHGLPGSVRDWRWLAPTVVDRCRLIRVDMPGLGQSDAGLAPPTAAAVADVLVSALDRLGVDCVVVLGHSFGSVVAVALAAAVPERVAGLGLLAGVGLRPHASFRATPMKIPLTVALSLPGGAALLGPRLRDAIVRFGFPSSTTVAESVRTMQMVGRHRFSAHARRLRALTAPCLVAWADDDRLVEADIAAELAEILPPGPRLHFPEGGHNIQKSQAVELGEAITRFAVEIAG